MRPLLVGIISYATFHYLVNPINSVTYVNSITASETRKYFYNSNTFNDN